ncbi:MAG: hypothetical protein ACM34H_10520 [Deltaproteobacteria bacterium]
MTRPFRFPLILLLILLWLASGCTAYTLREAQDSFNKAAEIELRALDRSLRTDNPEASPSDAMAALNSYRLADSAVTKLITTDSRTLKEDNLLGAAYVLKAMALWRISDLEAVQPSEVERPGDTQPVAGGKPFGTRQELLALLGTIEQLRANHEIMLGTRDLVLFRALYGFYDHDGGRAESDFAKARVWFQSADRRLKESLAGVPPQHPVQVYVGSARLRTLAAWNQALYVGKRSSADPQVVRQDQRTINETAREVYCGLRSFWETNADVKKSLAQLLAAIGLPSMSCE